MRRKLTGIAVAPGIAVGEAFRYFPEAATAEYWKCTDTELEIGRFHEALEIARSQLQELQRRASEEVGEETAAVFSAHELFLDDPELVGQVENEIREQGSNAEFAVQRAFESYEVLLAAMDDEYMSARAADVRDVAQRLVRILMGVEEGSLAGLDSPVVVVAHDLTPSDTARMNKKMVLGFATSVGGKTSHTAIMARILGIPAVVGLGEAVRDIRDGETLVVDGGEGRLVVGPSPTELDAYHGQQKKNKQWEAVLKGESHLPAVTVDGHEFEVVANIGDVDSARAALEYGAEGVGLLRTEFLYLNRDSLPDEEEQYQAYAAIAEAMGKRAVVVRTLDIGGDKQLPYLGIGPEQNPFLGWRAIRFCLDNPALLKAQLRAILRASAGHDLRIMFPMIATVTELRRAKAIMEETRSELQRQGMDFDPGVELGIMIEVPAAALGAGVLAREVDFFSIGTNDLIQYTMACDRGNERVGYLYEPLNPVVLRMVSETVSAGHERGIWVGMCGEMAGDLEAIPLLVGMGLDELSMNPASIPAAKHMIRRMRAADSQELVEQALECATAQEVQSLVRAFVERLADSGAPAGDQDVFA